jgi:RHS repeat-associated protein
MITTTATYAYDPLDRLVSKSTSDGVATIYLYVGLSQTVAQTLVSNGSTSSVTRQFSDAAGSPIATQTTTTPYTGNPTTADPIYIGTNAHGDVTWTADTNGAVCGTAAYDPFGVRIATSGPMPASGWQGSLLDQVSGLYYVVARWYSPALGRFLSVDPKAGNTSTPQSLDRYAYVSGDPLGGVDPLGTCTFNNDTHQCVDAPVTTTAFDYHSIVIKPNPSPAPPVNKCLATNFHADGCTGGPIWKGKSQSDSGSTCATTSGHASCGGWVAASPDLQAASDIIREQIRSDPALATEQQHMRDALADYNNQKAAKAKAAPRDCGFGGLGCIDLGGVANTVNQAVSVVSNNASTLTHVALGVASMVPVIGSVAALADAGLYLSEGDYTSAALSMLAVIPGGAIIGKATELARGISEADKAINLINDANKVERLISDADKVEQFTQDAGKAERGVQDAAKGGVYTLRNKVTDEVMYVGRSNDVGRRLEEHGLDAVKGRLKGVREFATDSYQAQRGLEQSLFEKYGGPELNKIRPISETNKNAWSYMQAAGNFLASAGL